MHRCVFCIVAVCQSYCSSLTMLYVMLILGNYNFDGSNLNKSLALSDVSKNLEKAKCSKLVLTTRDRYFRL